MLWFMGDNKRLIHLHEHKLSDLEFFKSDTQIFQKNTSASLKNLETQVGQLALNMQTQNKGAFPSDTQKNPKDCMAFQFRSGKELGSSSRKERKEGNEEEQEETGKEEEKNMPEKITEASKQAQTEQPERSCEQKQKEKAQAYTPAEPFPQRLQKARRKKQFSKFLDIFKKIEFNIPFAEAINQMPNYAKFLKEIQSKKRKISEEGIVNLTATCSAVIQQKLLEKVKDLGISPFPAL